MIRPAELDTERGRAVWGVITAAAKGDAPAVRRLLERDPSLSRGDPSFRSPIQIAVLEGHVEVVRLLLEAGADSGLTNFWGDTLVDMATDRGHQAIAAMVREARARSSRVNPAETQTDHPIHRAAEAGDVQRVRALLDYDPELVHQSDRAGGLPLHRAVVGRAPKMVALLLDRGADIHAIHGSGLGSQSGYAPENLQPIDLAIWGGPMTSGPSTFQVLIGTAQWWLAKSLGATGLRPSDVESARLLISRGATHDLTIAAALGDLDRVTRILDDDPSRIRDIRPNGRLALSAATEFGHESIVRLLLERGADPTWSDADAPRGAALHAAARAGNRKLVELLLAHGADPNGHVDAAGNATFAARTRELRALLTAHGGKVDPYDLVWMDDDEEVMRRVTDDPSSANAGCGGVFTAVCTRGKRELLVRLLDAGIRVPSVAGGCQSYLLEKPDMLRLLLASGMSPDYPTPEGLTFLHLLCSRDVRNRTMEHRPECAAILIDAGATISAKDREYRSTPLAWAARNNLPDMVKFLLARGAPANLPDDQPWATPLAWATRRGHLEIVEMLKAAGATG
ncbi:MAG TPA: ankyrin repeat domain-containing protein [Vicinamibacterales bacterium]|nr:ankyrin repeat domain-containing protein [Vicinamibacterales bacterium]